jgi:hypothetical protein
MLQKVKALKTWTPGTCTFGSRNGNVPVRAHSARPARRRARPLPRAPSRGACAPRRACVRPPGGTCGLSVPADGGAQPHRSPAAASLSLARPASGFTCSPLGAARRPRRPRTLDRSSPARPRWLAHNLVCFAASAPRPPRQPRTTVPPRAGLAPPATPDKPAFLAPKRAVPCVGGGGGFQHVQSSSSSSSSPSSPRGPSASSLPTSRSSRALPPPAPSGRASPCTRVRGRGRSATAPGGATTGRLKAAHLDPHPESNPTPRNTKIPKPSPHSRSPPAVAFNYFKAWSGNPKLQLGEYELL